MANKKLPPLDNQFFTLVGNIAHDWSTLEYTVNDCIWDAAMLDQQLGACITAQIFSLNPRLEALALLLRARGASDKIIRDTNEFIAKLRHPTDIRNRAVHDPLGIHEDSADPMQLQITAKGRLVFELRKISLGELEKHRDEVSNCLETFMALRDRIKVELSALPYKGQKLFPSITRTRNEHRPQNPSMTEE